MWNLVSSSGHHEQQTHPVCRRKYFSCSPHSAPVTSPGDLSSPWVENCSVAVVYSGVGLSRESLSFLPTKVMPVKLFKKLPRFHDCHAAECHEHHKHYYGGKQRSQAPQTEGGVGSSVLRAGDSPVCFGIWLGTPVQYRAANFDDGGVAVCRCCPSSSKHTTRLRNFTTTTSCTATAPATPPTTEQSATSARGKKSLIPR